MEKPQYHFIIGSGRSGTTLLNLILNAHSKIVCLPEVGFILKFYNLQDREKLLSRESSEFIKKYLKEKYVFFNEPIEKTFSLKGIWQVNIEEMLAYIEESVNFVIFRDFVLKLGTFITPINQHKNPQIVIEKNPAYTIHTDKVMHYSPNSKFVVIMRDYRSVVLSKMESRGNDDIISNFAYYAYLWNCKLDRFRKDFDAIKERTLIVKYEDLVANPERIIIELCKFLGVEFENEMLSHSSNTNLNKETIKGERLEKKIGDLAKPINTDRIAAWKKKLSVDQINSIEIICNDLGQEYGYPPTQMKTSLQKLTHSLKYFPYNVLSQLVFLFDKHVHHTLPPSLKIYVLKFFKAIR